MKVLQILLFVLGLSVFANAQKSVLSGRIYDANGALIIGAKVTAVNENGEKFESVTDNNGIYTLNLFFKSYNSKHDYKIVKYNVTAEHQYFEQTILKEFKFVPSYEGKMNLDFALDVKVFVNYGAGGDIPNLSQSIESSNQKISNIVSEKSLENLPKTQNKIKRKKIK